MSARLELPLRTKSVLNLREHWAARMRRNQMQRRAVAQCWPWQLKRKRWKFPLEVVLIRRGPRKLDDDNLRAALKAVRDQVAAQLRIDDGCPDVRWEYQQEKGEYAVVIAIHEEATA